MFTKTLRDLTVWTSLLVLPVFATGTAYGDEDGNDTEPDAAEQAEPELLTIGSEAPSLAISEWIKGDPIAELSADQVYVVEFWATWCGPCIASMPHMAGLQTEYGDKVRFVGISDEDADTVNGFMEREQSEGRTWAEVLTYTIALDDNDQTNQRYMKAAMQNGIPTAFIVGGDGRIDWIGHPMSIDEPLAKVVEGTWDRETAKAEMELRQKEEQLLGAAMRELNTAMRAGNYGSAVGIVNDLLKELPDSDRLKNIRMQILKMGVADLTEQLGAAEEDSVKSAWDNPQTLNGISWNMATTDPPRNLPLAQKAAERAVELTESDDASILDTLARVYFVQGKTAQAIEWQTKAVDAADEPQLKARLTETLAEFKAAAGSSDEE